jgi:Fe2+ transport system protein FeoA
MARVTDIAGATPWQREQLQAYGLAPGRQVTMLQRTPAFVVAVEQVELAFDADVARCVLVESEGGSGRPLRRRGRFARGL